MKTVRLLYHLVRADFLERVRRYSFLVTLVLALYLGYIYVPDSSARYVTVSLDNMRGVYNSAWVGAVFSLMSSTFLSLIGFYLVKNAVTRDYDTRVGQILASTPLSKFSYLLGKTLSNVAVLSAMAGVLLISAAAMQLIRGEDKSIHVWQLISPMLFMALPFLFIISALAVLFEVTPKLRGALGNVVYFFLWNLMLVLSLGNMDKGEPAIRQGYNDLPGASWILQDMTRMVSGIVPKFKGNVSLGIQVLPDGVTVKTFVWPGIDWTVAMVAQRLLWVAVAVGIVLVATPIFRRFEIASPKAAKKKGKKRSEEEPAAPVALVEGQVPMQLTGVPVTAKPTFWPMLTAELNLTFRGVGKWWYLVAGALVVATLLAPMEAVRAFIYPAAWIWPVAMWSAMGTWEKRYATEQVMFASPNLLTRQLPAVWLAGVAIALVTGIGMGARFAVIGDSSGLLAWGVGMLFVPTLALASGVWTGRPLLFEAVYVALWYIGPMNQVPLLDYMGVSAKTGPGNTMVFLVLTIGLMIAALVGRRRQLVL